MSNRAFVVFISLVLALGLTTGYHLSGLPRLETYKLLNVVGLFYDFLGVVVLSEIAVSSGKWKKVSVDWIAPAVLWLHMVFPLGVFVGGLLAAVVLHSSSGDAVSQFAVVFWAYSMIPLTVLNETVVFPQFAFFRGLETRWRWFGLYLLLSGVGLQLIGALLGLKA
jgi:hypothetical protein